MAFHGYSTTLDKVDAPLNVMAELANAKLLQIPLSLGALVSFFALCLSCLNAGSRVIYAMGQHGLFHEAVATSHETNETPHYGVAIMASLAFAIPTILSLRGADTLDIFNWVGTLAAFGFIVPYGLIVLAAPAYLKKTGELRPYHIVPVISDGAATEGSERTGGSHQAGLVAPRDGSSRKRDCVRLRSL
jgi:amino acid transporter